MFFTPFVLSASLTAPSFAQGFSPTGGCDGFLDYSDELIVDASTIVVTELPLADDFVQLQISGIEIANQSIGDFRSATAFPEPRGTPLELRPDRVRSVAFDETLAGGTVFTDDSLQVELPADDADAFIADLRAGTIPFVVHGAEIAQLAERATIFHWDQELDDAYDWANRLDPKVNVDPGPGPWKLGGTFELTFAFADDVPDALLGLDPQGTRLIVLDDYQPDHLPEAVQHLSVDTISIDDSEPTTIVTVTGHLSDETDMRDMYRAASLCASGHIDWPVRQTRLFEVDGQDQELDDVNKNTLPIRFNGKELLDGRVTLTGQVHAQVLKPTWGVRIREGVMTSRVDFDSELSFAGQLSVLETFTDYGETELWELAFPFPDFSLGGIAMEQYLRVEHFLYSDISMRAGAVVGISKTLKARQSVVCDFALDAPPACRTEHNETPAEEIFDISPPQLVHNVGGTAEFGTRMDATWVVGTRTRPPVISTEATISTEAYGVLDVRIGRQPWWTIGHGARLKGSVALKFFNEDLAEHSFDLWESPVHIDAEAPPPNANLVPTLQRYLSGEDMRWLVSTDIPGSEINHPSAVDVAVMNDGSIVAAVVGSKSHRILKFDRFGELLWTQTYLDGYKPRTVMVLPDQTIVVGGARTFVAAHEPTTGALLWARTYDVVDDNQAGACSINDLAVRETSTGPNQIVAVGEFGRATVTQDEGCAMLLDADDGDVKWVQLYVGDKRQELHGVTVLRDGGIVAAGHNGWRHPDHLDAGANGWLVRIDPEDGDLVWNVITPTKKRGGHLKAVTEGANGQLLAVGSASRDVRHTGSAFLVSISAHGHGGQHGIFLHDAITDTLLTFEEPQLVVSSDTALDWFHDVVAVEGGFVVAGHTSDWGQTGWVVKVGDNLGVDWFMTLDGESEAALTSIARTDGGMVLGGFSKSASATGPVLLREEHVVVAKIPYEGKLTVHPTFPYLETPMLSPGMRGSSTDADISVLGATYSVASVTTVEPAFIESSEAVDVTRAAELECALLMTPTGHATPKAGCPDQPDVFFPIVRITSPEMTAYGWSESVLLDALFDDEAGIATSDITLGGVRLSNGGVLVMADLGVGEHTVWATATDPSGNVAEDSVPFTVFDDEPPAVTVTSPQATPYDRATTSHIDVTFTATDQATDVVSAEVTLNGVPVSGDSLATADLPLGEHTVAVVAVDRAHNATTVEVVFTVIDSSDPMAESPPCGCQTSGPVAMWWLPLLGLLARRRR